MRSAMLLLSIFVCSLYWGLAEEGCAQDSVQPRPRKFSAEDASAAAYQRAEARRRGEFARHVGTIEYIRWLNGQRIYGSLAPPYPADRAAFYGYGGRSRAVKPASVFEPWPYLPGDIWGFSYGPANTHRSRARTRPTTIAAPRAEPASAEPVPAGPVVPRRGPVSF